MNKNNQNRKDNIDHAEKGKLGSLTVCDIDILSIPMQHYVRV